jgi:orotidine-5'-phosphate decarboxylase
MNRKQLSELIFSRQSFLCVGLDSDIAKIPRHLLNEKDPVAEFNRQIIDATKDLCVSYKINTAFYESRGIKGWESLEKTLEYIPDEIFTIADAKRGDIGNTAEHYAKTFFETFPFDSVTLSPYMGADTVTPYLKYKDKWVIILGLTSNPGAADIEMLKLESGKEVYQEVLRQAALWGSPDHVMFVTGATRQKQFETIREIIPEHFLLVPGVGAQGGDLDAIARLGMNDHCGLLVNASRSIIFAGAEKDFPEKARAEAEKLQQQMVGLLKEVAA